MRHTAAVLVRHLDGTAVVVNPWPRSSQLLKAETAGISGFLSNNRSQMHVLSMVVLGVSFNYRTKGRNIVRSPMKPKLQLGQAESPSREASAEYIALEASRLARIANAREFPLLAYLIDMVVLEAWREANEAESTSSDDAFRGADGV